MSDAAEPTKRSKSKPRNNLNSFDTEQIEAELFAIESETFNTTKKMAEAPVVEPTASPSPSTAPTEEFKVSNATLNPIGFSADNSKLLHSAVRNGAAQSPEEIKSRPAKIAGVPKPNQKQDRSGNPIANKRDPAPKLTVRNGGMDGFNKLTTKLNASNQTVVNSLNSSSVALSGLKHANAFNSYSQRNYKTSMHAQIENKSLFQNSFDNKPDIFDHGVRDIDSRRRYNKLKRSHKLLGGVDQHNLGAGPIRRAISGRSVKLITPILALLFIGGLVMYNNAPNISLKIAESKSGIAVNQPSYAPNGFRLDKSIDAETGKVAMSFVNDNKAYNVTQSISDWDSKALLENKVSKESNEYSSYTDRGLTIYVYNGKAVWVNQGKINEIDTLSSGLEIEEMVRIAGSM